MAGLVPASRNDLLAGTVIANPDGFGFLRPEAGGDDLFLTPFEMRKVSHGDRVLVSITGVDRRGRGEASIVEVPYRQPHYAAFSDGDATEDCSIGIDDDIVFSG